MAQYQKVADLYLIYRTVCIQMYPTEEKCLESSDPWLSQFDKRGQKYREDFAGKVKIITSNEKK
jgi:hypothetical protein